MHQVLKPRLRTRLTTAHDMFCQQVALNGNATAAYAEAFPNSRQWKRKSRTRRASELMSRPGIVERIDELYERATLAHDLAFARRLDRLFETRKHWNCNEWLSKLRQRFPAIRVRRFGCTFLD